MTGAYLDKSLYEILSVKNTNNKNCFLMIDDKFSYNLKDFRSSVFELSQQAQVLKQEISLQLKAQSNAIKMKEICFDEKVNKLRLNTEELLFVNSEKLNQLIKRKKMMNECFEAEKLLKTKELAEVQNENFRLQEEMLKITKKNTVSYFAKKNTAENNLQKSRKELSSLISQIEKKQVCTKIQEKNKFKEIQSNLHHDTETIKTILAEIQKIHSEQLLTKSKFFENSASLQNSLKICELKIEKLKKIFLKTDEKKIFFLETAKKLVSQIPFFKSKFLKLEKKNQKLKTKLQSLQKMVYTSESINKIKFSN